MGASATISFPRAADLDEYFALRIEPVESGCWEWRGGRNRDGYGNVGWKGKYGVAHRWLWKRYVGDLPDELQLDHLCCNTGCVNPDHLEPVTHAENMARADCSDNGAWQLAKTHCPHGHPLSGDNVYMWNGTRYCRQCRRERNREQSARRRGSMRD